MDSTGRGPATQACAEGGLPRPMADDDRTPESNARRSGWSGLFSGRTALATDAAAYGDASSRVRQKLSPKANKGPKLSTRKTLLASLTPRRLTPRKDPTAKVGPALGATADLPPSGSFNPGPAQQPLTEAPKNKSMGRRTSKARAPQATSSIIDAAPVAVTAAIGSTAAMRAAEMDMAVVEENDYGEEEEDESEEMQTIWQAAFTFFPVLWSIVFQCAAEILEAGVCHYALLLVIPIYSSIRYLLKLSEPTAPYSENAPPPPPSMPSLYVMVYDGALNFAEA